jgi:hypothetical protein
MPGCSLAPAELRETPELNAEALNHTLRGIPPEKIVFTPSDRNDGERC